MVMYFVPPAVGIPASNASITYVGAGNSASNSSSYTFSGVSVGPAADDRIIAASIVTRLTGGADPTGVSINGTPMSRFSSVNNGEVNTSAWRVARGVVPTGTTATFVITTSATSSLCILRAFRIVGQADDVPYLTKTAYSASSSTSVNLSLGVSFTDGATLGVATGPNTSATFTWSGLTEAYDGPTESDNAQVTGALANSLPSSIVATASSSLTGLMGISATWR